MLKKLNMVGVVIGGIIIVFSIIVFVVKIETVHPNMNEIALENVSAPGYESDKAYGGDAYTGMQQASAQAANNLISVFDAIEVNNNAIRELNDNNIKAAAADAYNAAAIISTIKLCVGFILLSIGLIVVSKSVEVEILFTKKEKQLEAPEDVIANCTTDA